MESDEVNPILEKISFNFYRVSEEAFAEYQIEGWDSEPIYTDLDFTEYDLIKSGLSLCRGFFSTEISPSQYNDARKQFSDICANMLVNSSKVLRAKTQYMTKFEDSKIEGKTPDIYYMGGGLRIQTPTTKRDVEIIDFKSSLSEYSPTMQGEMKEEIIKKYGALSDKLTIIYMVLDENFPSSINLGPKMTEMYLRCLNSIWRSFKTLNSDRKIFMSEFGRKIVDGWGKIYESLNQDDILQISPDYPNFFTEEYRNEWIDYLEEFVPWFDSNYMLQKDGAKISLDPLVQRVPNISAEKPFDRTFNMSKYDSVYGHKSSYLMFFPIHKDLLLGSASHLELIRDFLSYSDFKDSLDIRFRRVFEVCLELHILKNKQIRELKALAKEFAFYFTELDKDTLNKMDSSRKQEYEKVNLRRKELLEEANMNRQDWMITKVGYIRLKLLKDKENNLDESSYLGINRQTNKYFKENEDHIDFQNLSDKWVSDIYNCFPTGSGFNTYLKDFYPGNESLNDHCNSLLFNSQSIIDDIMTHHSWGYFEYCKKFMRAIAMAFPSESRKKASNNDFSIVEMPGMSCVMLTSAPVGMTSGVIVVLCKLQSGTRFPEGWIPYEYFDSNGCTYAVSKPFRIQMDIINNFDEMACSYLSLSVMSRHYGLNLNDNALFHSLWWSYVRMLNASLDMVYFLCKNAINYGSMGRIEYAEKFVTMTIRDVRVGLIVKNLLNNYEGFCESFELYTKEDLESNKRINIADPVFGFNHVSLQTLLIIIYLRQIYLKHDAFDENYWASFYYLQEADFQKDYENSPFHPDKFSALSKIGLKETARMIIKGDSTTKIAYNPAVCYHATRLLCEEASERHPWILNGNNFLEKGALATQKQSKVLMYDAYNLPELSSSKKNDTFTKSVKKFNIDKSGHVTVTSQKQPMKQVSSYTGIQSINLPEALAIECLEFKSFLNENLQYLGLDNLTPAQIEAYDPGLMDLVLLELRKRPRKSILTLKMKDQKGYPKRAFFIQTLDGRNKRKFADEAFNNLLKFCKQDMIMDPGDKKLIKLENKMHAQDFSNKTGLVITEDISKYGDLYILNAFKPLFMALRDSGYFTQQQASYQWACLNDIYNRVLLMPKATRELLTKPKHELLEKYPPSTTKGDKFWAMYDKLMENFKDETTWSFYDGDKEVESVKVNPGIRKAVGFVLGVYNKLGSVHSANQLLITKYLFSLFNMKGRVDGATHSDDSIKYCNIPRMKNVDLSLVDMKDFFEKLRSNGSVNISSGKLEATVTYDMQVEESGTMVTKRVTKLVQVACITKLAALISLSAPRLIGQRPSNSKWGIGPTGEVLQVFCMKGRMIPPIMRFANAIGADLPGKSPYNDLSSAVGRVFQLISNGMNIACVSSMMLIANIFVWDRFGYEVNNMTQVNRKHPSLGGWVWFYPPLLLKHGFLSNDLRLMSMANTQGYHDVKNQFILLVDTNDVFKQKSSLVQDVDIQSNSDITVEPTENEGAVLAFKDFPIRFNRMLRTLYSFSVLVKKYHSNIIDFINELLKLPYRKDVADKLKKILEETSPSVMIQKLNTLILDRTVAKTGDFRDHMIAFLKKYVTRSFQESYLRIPEGVLMINRLGYKNRWFPNPFQIEFLRLYAPEYIDSLRMTVDTIWDIILKVSRSNTALHFPRNTKMFNMAHDFRLNSILQLHSITLEVYSEKPNNHEKELSMKWNPIDLKSDPSMIDIPPNLLIAAYLQKQLMSLDYAQLPVVKQNPAKFTNQHVLKRLKVISELIDKHQIKITDLVRNAHILSKIFDTSGFLGVFRGFPNKDLMESYILGNMYYDRICSGKINIDSSKVGLRMSEGTLSELVAQRLISLAFLLNQYEYVSLSTISYESNKSTFTLPEVKAQLGEPWIRGDIPSEDSCNRFLLHCLLEDEILNKRNIQFYRYIKNDDRIIGCRYRGSFYFIRRFETSASGEPKYVGYTNDVEGRKVLFMMYFCSYCMHDKKSRLVTANNFLKDKELTYSDTRYLLGEGKSEDYVRGNFLQHSNLEIASSGFGGLAIYLASENWFKDTVEKSCIKSSVSNNSYVFDYPNGSPYYIQLWDMPSNPSNMKILWTDNEGNKKSYLDANIGFAVPEFRYTTIALRESTDSSEVISLNWDSPSILKMGMFINVMSKLCHKDEFFTLSEPPKSVHITELIRYNDYLFQGFNNFSLFIYDIDAEESPEDFSSALDLVEFSSISPLHPQYKDILLFTQKVLEVLSDEEIIPDSPFLTWWRYSTKSLRTREKVNAANLKFGKNYKSMDVLKTDLNKNWRDFAFDRSHFNPTHYSFLLFVEYLRMIGAPLELVVRIGRRKKPSIISHGTINLSFRETLLRNHTLTPELVRVLYRFNVVY